MSTFNCRTFAVGCAIALIATTETFSQPATFIRMGDLPGGTFSSDARAVANGGVAVVGYSMGSTSIDPVGFIWTPQAGIVALPLPFVGSAGPRGLSGDGLITVGLAQYSANDYGACRWINGGNPAGLSPLAADAWDISEDGSVIVGNTVTYQGFFWTESLGIGFIDSLAEGTMYTYAVSPDGAVIVGSSASHSYTQEAYRYTQADGTVGLGALSPPGSWGSVAMDASRNGAVIVGESAVAESPADVAFVWKQARGMQRVGAMPDAMPGTGSGALSVSGDGEIVVGFGYTSLGLEAFVWNACDGNRNLRLALEADHGIDLTGWRLAQAFDISTDGLAIVGSGINPDGNPEGWMVRFDCRLGDTNEDRAFDSHDISTFLATVMNPGAASTYALCAADFNRDGQVNSIDVQKFAERLVCIQP